MTQQPLNPFDHAVEVCRRAYSEFRQLAGRTDAALYRALGHAYTLQHRMDSDADLRAKFDELLQAYPQKTGNGTLFLMKYLFFPDTLQPGPRHKADIDKASRYAKLLNLALVHNVRPDEFVAFARDMGIQRTAAASGRKRLPRPPAKRQPRAFSVSADANRGTGAGIFADALSPRQSWFYSPSIADRFTAAVERASEQPQKITVTIYLNHERAVITGIAAQDHSGAFPAGAIKVAGSEAGQAAPPARAKANPLLRLRSSPPQPGTLSASPTGSAARRPHRATDGVVWPSWR